MKRMITCLVLPSTLIGCQDFHTASETVRFSATPKVVTIAQDDIIRIVTPFAEPRVITTSDAEITRSQHVLYVLPSDQQTISMFVTDADNEAHSVNLTLRPELGGVREVDVAVPGPARTIRTASADGAVSKTKVLEVAAKPKPLIEEWSGKKCRLCRADGQSGSDYNDGSNREGAW